MCDQRGKKTSEGESPGYAAQRDSKQSCAAYSWQSIGTARSGPGGVPIASVRLWVVLAFLSPALELLRFACVLGQKAAVSIFFGRVLGIDLHRTQKYSHFLIHPDIHANFRHLRLKSLVRGVVLQKFLSPSK